MFIKTDNLKGVLRKKRVKFVTLGQFIQMLLVCYRILTCCWFLCCRTGFSMRRLKTWKPGEAISLSNRWKKLQHQNNKCSEASLWIPALLQVDKETMYVLYACESVKKETLLDYYQHEKCFYSQFHYSVYIVNYLGSFNTL